MQTPPEQPETLRSPESYDDPENLNFNNGSNQEEQVARDLTSNEGQIDYPSEYQEYA